MLPHGKCALAYWVLGTQRFVQLFYLRDSLRTVLAPHVHWGRPSAGVGGGMGAGNPSLLPGPYLHLRAQSLRLPPKDSWWCRVGMRRPLTSHKGGKERPNFPCSCFPASQSPHCLPIPGPSSQVTLFGPHKESPGSSGVLRQLGSPFPVPGLWARFGSVSLYTSGQTLICRLIHPKPQH